MPDYLECGCEKETAGMCVVCKVSPAINAKLIHGKWVHYCEKSCLLKVFLMKDNDSMDKNDTAGL